jgi:hypothetical protein
MELNKMSGPYRTSLIAWSISSALALTACGGGSGDSSTTTTSTDDSTTVIGLKMPSKMNLVGTQTTTGARYAGRGIAQEDLDLEIAARMVDDTVVNAFSSSSDYVSDDAEAETWVWDPSMESLSIVNEILCYVQQTGAKELVNSGGYIALINEDKCQEGQNQSTASSGGAQSSSSNTNGVEYNNWTVVSTRADNNSPQIVKIWVPGEPNPSDDDPMGSERILVETSITEGVSVDKPFGSFVLNFKGEAPIGPGGSYVEIMQGTLRTVENTDGKPQFEYYSTSSGETDIISFDREEKSNVVMDDSDGTTGQARTFVSETFNDPHGSGSKSQGYNVAYNNDYFLRGKDTTGDNNIDERVCTARNDYSTQTWNYNLYHTTSGSFNDQQVSAGQRVSLNSGFPFYYDDSSGRHFGHVGYWGVWTEENLSLDELSGQQITRQSFGDESSAETYTVRASTGKLWRRIKVASSYAEMVGTTLNWFGDLLDPDCNNGCMEQQDYRATVVDQGGGVYKLMVTDSLNWGEGGPSLSDIPDVDITPSNDWNQRWMWADTLGGSVVFKSTNALEPVVFFKEDQVSPGEQGLPAQLYCYERCLKGGLTSNAGLTGEADLFHVLWNDGTQQHAYTLTTSNGQFVLTDENGDPVEIGFDLSNIAQWYDGGVNTGEMVTTAISPAQWWSLLDNAEVTYRWETGKNPWNRTVSITDSNGVSQSFDKPLQFQYAYLAGDDPNDSDLNDGLPFLDGTPFLLEYGGPGELWGFPWEKMDPNCDENSEDCRWVSGLTLKTGVELLDDENHTFIIRAMQSEQSMNALTDTTACTNAGLSVDNINLTLPGAVSGTVSISWTDKPVITDPPAVIEGVIQTQ